ncbi:hypothetical protein [Convivina intestini]|uniref:Uncharacterized protein n=1 Tax=Convivina intestini TaxID=1505726 RepID=A0A2U1DBU0_9LACO|nr:hypothetical protein [Convivina intestini]PVY85116.1 hypothetical protein C7384_103141 [Convivina intestini]CAH1853818.1 hypothetical protein R077811_00793 [Convivina intestini]SDB88401.1 hypothetical protein SAMN05216341_10313 [Leuconostocaceae bacterium R-53105]
MAKNAAFVAGVVTGITALTLRFGLSQSQRQALTKKVKQVGGQVLHEGKKLVHTHAEPVEEFSNNHVVLCLTKVKQLGHPYIQSAQQNINNFRDDLANDDIELTAADITIDDEHLAEQEQEKTTQK